MEPGRCGCCCFSPNVVFHLVNPDSGDKVGEIKKMWNGPMEMKNTEGDYDQFGIDFPDNADLGSKIILIAACFMIDYLYFEG